MIQLKPKQKKIQSTEIRFRFKRFEFYVAVESSSFCSQIGTVNKSWFERNRKKVAKIQFTLQLLRGFHFVFPVD